MWSSESTASQSAFWLRRAAWLGAAALLAGMLPALGAELLATHFQDHAVLQRDAAIPVWGKADPGARLTVRFDGKAVTATAAKDGRWQVKLPAHGAGGPYTLSVSDAAGHSQMLQDILVGDTYLCSGQSNMEWPVQMAMQGDADARAAGNTNIRLLKIERAYSPTPQQDFTAPARWAVAGPDAVRGFSAVCYYFGRALQPAAGVPLGLIYAAWGGSNIQTWMPSQALGKLGGYDGALKALALYAKAPEQAEAQWHQQMLGWWHDHDPASAAVPAWHDAAYADDSWKEVTPSGAMRDWGAPDLAGFYGIVWLRTTVTLTAAQAAQGADLQLGPIDQVDTTWVNGKDVGSMEGWGTDRVYHIAPGTLKAGANVIAVGFYGGDGMWGPASARRLHFSDGHDVAVGPRWRYHPSVEGYKAGTIPHAPWLKEIGQTVLYNAMIAPLRATPVKAVLWYQGESNIGEADQYQALLTGLVGGWRKQFGAKTPFLIVQLPNYGTPVTKPAVSSWAATREAQRQTALMVDGVTLVSAIDMGDRFNLHPVVKQEVGRRLALAARHVLYGEKIVSSGPTPLAATREGAAIRVRFDNVGGGLIAYGSDDVVGFDLCDSAKQCRFVRGTIHGDSVVLTPLAGFDAVTVRYGWADSPLINLYNAESLPAVPFERSIN